VLKNIGNSIATLTFVVLAAMPAAAQPGVRVDIPLPGLEIHVAHTAPPSLRREQRPSRPGREFTWVQGFWHWQGNDWAWIPGRWDRPNDRGSRWVQARYAREGGGWRYEPGHWSNQRVIEGDDYRRWRSENGRDRDHGRDRDRDHDRDRDRDRDRDHSNR